MIRYIAEYSECGHTDGELDEVVCSLCKTEGCESCLPLKKCFKCEEYVCQDCYHKLSRICDRCFEAEESKIEERQMEKTWLK